MHLCKRHVWICMDTGMGQHGYSMAMLNPWCPVSSTSHGEPWKYQGDLWKPHGVPWCTRSHPWCAMENLWCPMESPWCSMENPRDTMEYFCKGPARQWASAWRLLGLFGTRCKIRFFSILLSSGTHFDLYNIISKMGVCPSLLKSSILHCRL